MRKLACRGLLLMMGAGLAACEDSNAVFVEHLAIVNINPSHGAVGIGYETDVTVTFSDVLNPATLSAASMCLTTDTAPPPDPANPCGTGTPVAGTVTYDAATLSARVVPSQPLVPGEKYTLHLMPAIEGSESGALPAIVRASFTTFPTS